MTNLSDERRAELEAMLTKMEQASSAFYYLAVRIGHHQFIEFNGLLGEYINICRTTLEAGKDFTMGGPLTIHGFQRNYLAEKLDCIFGTSMESLLEGKADA